MYAEVPVEARSEHDDRRCHTMLAQLVDEGDGDRVRPDGLPSWRDLLPARAALNEPTQVLDRPLMTRGQRYRANGGRW